MKVNCYENIYINIYIICLVIIFVSIMRTSNELLKYTTPPQQVPRRQPNR
jgi:hypothetical protein